jgi:hypothetical protein
MRSIGRTYIKPPHAQIGLAHAPFRRQQRGGSLGGAGCEDDMLLPGIDQRCDLTAGLLDQAARIAPLLMDRRRIGGNVQCCDHGLARAAKQRRAGVVVEIGANSSHFPAQFSLHEGSRQALALFP